MEFNSLFIRDDFNKGERFTLCFSDKKITDVKTYEDFIDVMKESEYTANIDLACLKQMWHAINQMLDKVEGI